MQSLVVVFSCGGIQPQGGRANEGRPKRAIVVDAARSQTQFFWGVFAPFPNGAAYSSLLRWVAVVA